MRAAGHSRSFSSQHLSMRSLSSLITTGKSRRPSPSWVPPSVPNRPGTKMTPVIRRWRVTRKPFGVVAETAVVKR